MGLSTGNPSVGVSESKLVDQQHAVDNEAKTEYQALMDREKRESR
jgi:deoxyinosine 3'endonuclease (endonuclease V)